LPDTAKLGWLTNYFVSQWLCARLTWAYQSVCNNVFAISFQKYNYKQNQSACLIVLLKNCTFTQPNKQRYLLKYKKYINIVVILPNSRDNNNRYTHLLYANKKININFKNR
jgi:hypothetical protein